ncbi:hypothetical protein STPH2_7386 [Streptomyces sp. KO7888]|nr:hypothetical protein [Streptomyces sp. KO7888]
MAGDRPGPCCEGTRTRTQRWGSGAVKAHVSKPLHPAGPYPRPSSDGTPHLVLHGTWSGSPHRWSERSLLLRAVPTACATRCLSPVRWRNRVGPSAGEACLLGGCQRFRPCGLPEQEPVRVGAPKAVWESLRAHRSVVSPRAQRGSQRSCYGFNHLPDVQFGRPTSR